MTAPNVICLAIDRLSAAYLGPYGNTWIRTPALNRLAAESFLFDRAIIDSPELDSLYRSLWLARHAMCPAVGDNVEQSLPARLKQNGYATALITDDEAVSKLMLSSAFDEIVFIRNLKSTPDGSDQKNAAQQSIAATEDETTAADFFVTADQWLDSAAQPYFLWLHMGALGQVWDAPLEFRQEYAAEDDPTPESWTDIPNHILPAHFDPDDLLKFVQAYAGQVSLIDQLLASFLNRLEASGFLNNTLLILMATRGFPLGEHRRIGPCDQALYSEVTHIPLMIRFPDGAKLDEESQSFQGRSPAIVQPADLSATIAEYCNLPPHDPSAATTSDHATFEPGIGRSLLPLVRGEQKALFDRACIVAPDGQQVLVTPAWSLRVMSSNHKTDGSNESANANRVESTAPMTELFVKPDDWFEANEIGNRCSEVVDEMRSKLEEFQTACGSGEPSEIAPLSDLLINGLN